MLKAGIFWWCLFCCFSLLFAENEDQAVRKVEPVGLTVSARAVSLSATSAAITVLTRQQIERSQSLRKFSDNRGLFMYPGQGETGDLTTLTIGGGDPGFTVVMIDGISV